MYEIMRRFKNRRFVLVDEGTVLSAHNVFVYSDALYTPEEIATFCDLLPLPDLIIYIRAPLEDLIRRSLQREDPPREMRSKDRLLVEKFIRRAVAVFEMLVTTERIRERVLIVENPSSADGRRQEAVESIVSYLLNHQRLDGLRTVSS
jgi:thymidylate kinase